jgi:hypothetical protein
MIALQEVQLLDFLAREEIHLAPIKQFHMLHELYANPVGTKSKCEKYYMHYLFVFLSDGSLTFIMPRRDSSFGVKSRQIRAAPGSSQYLVLSAPYSKFD